MIGKHQADFRKFPSSFLKHKYSQNKHNYKIKPDRCAIGGTYFKVPLRFGDLILEFWAVLISRCIISVRQEVSWVHWGGTDGLNCQWPQSCLATSWRQEDRNSCIQAALKSVSNYIHQTNTWLLTIGKGFITALTSFILLNSFARFSLSLVWDAKSWESTFPKCSISCLMQCKII